MNAAKVWSWIVIGSTTLVWNARPALTGSNEPLRITAASRAGELSLIGVFTNGVCTLERTDDLAGPWRPVKSIYTTSDLAQTSVSISGDRDFYRALALDLAGGRTGFTNLTRAYGTLTTVAGAGGIQDFNNWRPEFEGAPATEVLLSGPHMAMADRAGGVYIADKDAHGIRKIELDGTIRTVAGTSSLGDGPDTPTPGTEVAVSNPNGLWVRVDGTVYILDLGNAKVRRLDPNGILQTLFTVPGGISTGRGLWVSDDETLAYFSSETAVKRWRSSEGVTDVATGFSQLGNLTVNASGRVMVTDRGAHRVYELDAEGNRTVVAGNGLITGGGDGQRATETALEEVRGIWCLPSGAFFLATHRSSRVWYVDPEGTIHLFLNGNRNGAHAGDGTWFYNPIEARVSECRAVTMDHDGNLLITENDIGYIRKVQFLPHQP